MGAAESKLERNLPTIHHPNSFDRIPKELIDLILSLLEVQDLVHISCTCKKFRSEVFLEQIPFERSYYLYGEYNDEIQKIEPQSQVFQSINFLEHNSLFFF